MIAAVLPLLVAPQLVRLSNGIPVVIENRPGTSVAIEVQVDVSTATAKERSVLEVVAGAMLGESENMSLRAMQRLAWQIGGLVDSDLAGDALRFQIVTAKTHLQPAASFLCESLRRPLFTDEALDRASSAIKRRLRLTAQNPITAAVRRSAETAKLGPGGYAIVTKALATQYHAFFVKPSATTISVVGDVDADSISKLLGGFLGNWQETAARKPAAPKCDKNPPSTGFSTVTALVPGPLLKDPSFAAWYVMMTAVGKGKASFLNVELRENSGWSYFNDTTFLFSNSGSYAVTAAAHNGANSEGATLLKSALSRTDFDIARAKAMAKVTLLVGRAGQRQLPFAQGQASLGERAFSLAWWQLRAGSWSEGDRFAKAIDEVTPEQIAESAKKWLPLAKVVSE